MIVLGPAGQLTDVPKSWLSRSSTTPTGRWTSSSVWTSDYAATYEAMYRTQPWVYVCVNKLARAVARLPLHIYELDENSGDRERQREGTLADLLERPYPGASSLQLKQHLVGSAAVYGHGLVLKRRPAKGSPPDQLWPLDWRRVTVYGVDSDPMSPVDHYEYQRDMGSPELIQPEDVVHVQWWGPDGLGVSPLEPLRWALANEAATTMFSTRSFTNGVRPSGALVTPKNLNEQQRVDIRQKIDAWHVGSEKAGRFLLLDGGLQWQPFGGSAADGQMIEMRKLNRDEVAAAYDIPPPMIGILDRATFSNVDEQHRMLYQDTLGPWLTLVEQAFGAQLLAPEPTWADLFVEFLLDEVLRGDVEKRSQAYQRMLGGVYTPNELRRAENLELVDDPLADSIWLPLNMQPVNEELDEEEAPAELPAEMLEQQPLPPPPRVEPALLEQERIIEAVRALVAPHTTRNGGGA